MNEPRPTSAASALDMSRNLQAGDLVRFRDDAERRVTTQSHWIAVVLSDPSGRELMREVTLLRRQLKEARGLGRLLGTSRSMQEIYHLVEMAAPTNAPVLISGESGTGKELVARTLHEMSPRRKAPFVAVNCSAIPETLLESELFGHEKGAFTGADRRRIGKFEQCHDRRLLVDK